jgi:hypothetical protein
MASGSDPNGAPDELSEGRYVIEILTWDWNFFLGIPRETFDSAASKLIEARGIYIEGRVLAPKADARKSIRFQISPLRADYIVRDDGIRRIGTLKSNEGDDGGWDFDGQACVPDDAVVPILHCLGSIWRYLHVWLSDHSGQTRAITGLRFSRDDLELDAGETYPS